ncbi:hypothetical protein D9Q98_009293 [Chlorella vulgaris]|uniref:Uncharacterized protein n=1 Tax=Chlorella vulgaris TaxID=3077 RepID=A0A9D4TPH8_CHLVU|nr:hypothetical protein D9Q98_009293 [Chlorella vulgaris]
MRADTAAPAPFYATYTSAVANRTAAAALMASPASPGAELAQKAGNPTPCKSHELVDGEEATARHGAGDEGSVLVCSNSSASTASGGSQPAVNPCFIIGSKWLHAQASTGSLHPAAQRLSFESAPLPAAKEAFPAAKPRLNSSIKRMLPRMVLREHQQRCKKAGTAVTLPSTVEARAIARQLVFELRRDEASTADTLASTGSLHPAAQRLSFESAPLPAAK